MPLRIRHTLILAAGRGLRMGALTDVIPKPMAPYLNSTLIGAGIDKIRPLFERIHVTVGYKGPLLAQHILERGIDSIFNTEGHGNAWWIFHTLMRNLDEPVVVLTCDNVTDIDFASLENDYFAKGAPPCMLVPVTPVAGVAGDYIFADGDVVTTLGRERVSEVYCSGIQILNPARIAALAADGDSFYDVWNALIAARQLRVSSVRPKTWFSIDTIADLEKLAR
ncbi:MAG TPA: NTP transferase domain-containing protein [Polyangia bacterium]|jgi:NDP-sugar pyrophosphorylase family protein